MTAPERECQTCGVAVEQPQRGYRKFCSERCRKAQYSRPCVDCGKPLNGSDGQGANAPKRCQSCAPAESGPRRVSGERDEIARLWRSGLTLREIADRLGVTPSAVNHRLIRMRREGYDVPHRHTWSPEGLERAQNARRVAALSRTTEQ